MLNTYGICTIPNVPNNLGPDTPHRKKTLGAKIVRIGPDGASTYTAVTNGMNKEYWKVEDELLSTSIIKDDEEIVGVVEEVFYGSTLQRLEELAEDNSQGDRAVPVESVDVERQAQHWDRSVRPRPSTETQTGTKEGWFGAEIGRPLGKIFCREYILGVSVDAP